MKRIKKIIACMVMMSLVFTLAGCSKEKANTRVKEEMEEMTQEEDKGESSDENMFDDEEIEEDENQKQYYQEWGVDIDSPEHEITMQGDILEIPVTFSCVNTDMNSGFLVCLDGVIQKYSIDEESEKKYLCEFHCNDGEEKKMSLKLTPEFIKNGEDHELLICTVYEPGYRLEDETRSYGNYFHFSPIDAWTVHKDVQTEEIEASEESIAKNVPIDKDIFSLYIHKNADGTERNQLENQFVSIFMQDNQETDIIDAKKDFQIVFAGGESQLYKVCVFVNNEIQPAFDGEEYAYVKTDGTTMATLDVSLAHLDFDNLSPMYVLYIPVEAGEENVLDGSKCVSVRMGD
ncbi:MAG: hypothetical protein K6G65_10765 [Lachnospiraceae bacterium]|nr:hypothetical protein [Lachnospiraceae bacterium]